MGQRMESSDFFDQTLLTAHGDTISHAGGEICFQEDFNTLYTEVVTVMTCLVMLYSK